jgi:hypothetical protein
MAKKKWASAHFRKGTAVAAATTRKLTDEDSTGGITARLTLLVSPQAGSVSIAWGSPAG